MTLPESRTMTAHTTDGVGYYSFPSFDALGFVDNAFSTRMGGVSEGIYATMNLGFGRGDADENVRENYRRFCSAVGVSDADVVLSAQTHLCEIYEATAADRGRGITFPRGYTDIDGLMTDVPGVVLCTHYADCVPLLFVDPAHRAVAAAHAGWRGTVGRIGAVTLQRMHERYGTEPADVYAAIAPSIGGCCFEVDAPVWEAFSEMDVFDGGCYRAQGEKYVIDLWEVNRRVLVAAGVPAEHITVTDLCTRCHPDTFWSHRATNGQRGSLAAFIGIKKETQP